MMDQPKSLLQRLTQHTEPANPNDDPEVDGEAADPLGCWGWLRGVRDRAPMLELRRRDGTIRAISYGWLESVSFEPSGTITLYVNGADIKIHGRNLQGEARSHLRLLSMIARHRCLWIREVTREEDLCAPNNSPVIESILW